ncbi:MAG: hypothetical protein LBT62_03880 [Deltaproteobacteria bacterium]|jgi:hypothetical protein|nr:hypothetical protein [Deltaproteobacteria bacterium]
MFRPGSISDKKGHGAKSPTTTGFPRLFDAAYRRQDHNDRRVFGAFDRAGFREYGLKLRAILVGFQSEHLLQSKSLLQSERLLQSSELRQNAA